METEAEADLWEALPEYVLCSILGRLPVRVLARMRVVCKRWNSLLSPGNALQRIDPNFSVNSMPAFFIQLSRGPQNWEAWVIELGHNVSDLNIYKPALPRNRIVVNACKSICFCRRMRDSLNLSIGNPATRTWRHLPRPAHLDPHWTFNAMTFDTTSRRCTVLLGQNNVDWYRRRSGNSMVLEIYDSESNAWTRVLTEAPRFIQPQGKGSSWTEITLPEGCRNVGRYPASLDLSGCDGRVVLIQKGEELGSIRMWRLIEGQEAAKWFELHDMCSPERREFYLVAANSGWTIMVNMEMEIYLCNTERKSRKKISLPGQISDLRFLSAFESNNVWWP